MGLFDIFTRPSLLTKVAPAGVPGGGIALESPNQSSSLAKVVYAEYFAGLAGEVSRDTALMIPALKKARSIIVGIGASLPLKEYQGDTETTPAWLTSTTSQISPWHRIAYIIDDLFFYDWSALAVARDKADQIIDAVRIPFEQWSVDTQGRVLVNGKVASREEVVLIPGDGSGGILAAGAQTIKGARALETAWIGRAQNPIPLVELHQITDDEISDGSDDADDDEVGDMLAAWAAARTSPTGAVGFTDHRVEVRVHGQVATNLFEEGRNAIVLDVARLTGVPASILDGSQSTASLTYSTTEGKRNEFDDYTLPTYLGPIEARFSLDDVSPAGRVIRFDKSSRTQVAAPAIADTEEAA